MKKFLSLVLVLAMTFSLVAVSASAKEYTDDSKITYEDAVDVVSALGIVGGYSDGSFGPTATLTRGAAAKIICNMILGPTTASALGATTAPFSDVPANHTFAGYIAYCSQNGIISGYGDGTFRPSGSLTGYAFMKMLLGALGYKSEKEGFTGANWTVNVAKLAVGIGLNKGNGSFVGSKAVTREEACLYAFNTLQATMVDYGTTTTIVGDGINVSISGDARQVAQGSVYNNIFPNKGNTLEFAERYFSDLRVISEPDAFGRPAYTWSYKNAKIGNYAEAPVLTYTSTVKSRDIYNALGLGSAITAANVEVVRNGATTEGAFYVNSESGAVKGDAVSLTRAAGAGDVKIGGNGVVTEVYKISESPLQYRIVMIDTYVATVGSVAPATASADRTITLSPKTAPASSVYPGGVTNVFTFETESFAQKDLVTYTMAWDGAKFAVQSVKALAKANTGALTTFAGTDADDADAYFIANGTTYKYSLNAYFQDPSNTNVNPNFYNLKDELNVYCDEYGYAIYVEAVKTTTNYALVLGVGSTNPYGDVTRGATLLLADGQKVNVTYDTTKSDDMTAANTPGASNYITDQNVVLVTYTVGSNDVYTLKAVGTVGTGASLTNGKSLATVNSTSYYTTDATVYFVQTKTSNGYDYKAYIGYANMPTATCSGYVKYVLDNTYRTQLNTLLITSATVTGMESNGVYILSTKNQTVISEVDKDAYVELPAIVDGAVTTLKVSYNDLLASGKKLYTAPGSFQGFLVSNITTNSDGIVTDVTPKTAVAQNPSDLVNDYFTATGTVAAANGVIGFGTSASAAQYWAYRSDTQVVYVNEAGDTLSLGTVDGIATDTTDAVTYVVDTATKTVSTIYITVNAGI
jgi:hypothetical protein